MRDLTYAELFAGAGGLSLGLELADWSPVAHAEIEPHARAVLRHHWPDCRLDGDVSAIDGADYRGVTLLSGGSPCQDLSVAGKRAGMTEGSGTRSSLFFEQVRIWNESGAPYILWENVLGAFSSNNGADFAAVLSALVGAAIPVPANGWESAGVAAGATGVAAWRVLDCQFFGPPQRRRRVFVLGARTGGVDPAEVLALAEGVRGDSPARGEAGQATAADAGGGAGRAGGDAAAGDSADARAGVAGGVVRPDVGVRPVAGGRGEAGGALAWDDECNANGIAGPLNAGGAASGTRRAGVIAFRTDQEPEVTPGGICHTLDTGSKSGGGQTPAVLAFKPSHYTRDKDGAPSEIAAPLSADADRGDQEQVVVAFAQNQRGELRTSEVAPQLTTGGGKPGEGYGAVLTYDARGNGDGTTANTLAGDHQNRVTDYTAIVLRNREGKPGGGKGPLLSEERSLTLASANDQVVFTVDKHSGAAGDVAPTLKTDLAHQMGPVVANTVTAREHKGWNPARDVGNGAVQSGIPRRLMPVECERLMGWPDGHTAVGVDEQGREYELSDTARYRLCGNGVAAPVAGWIAWRLRWAIEAQG